MDWRSCACTMTSPSISWTRQLNVLAKCSVYSRTLHAPPLIRRSFVGRPALALDVNSKKQLPTIDIHHIHERMPLIWWTKTFNLSTYKGHSYGDYAKTIREYGTMDSYSTEPVREAQCLILLLDVLLHSRENWNTGHRKADIPARVVKASSNN